jgi:glutamyl-tRNA reductase
VRANSRQPLIAIDLALTHDFDPAVGELDGVELLTVESVCLAAPQEQAESLAQASGIVNGAAKAFEQERETRSVDSAIVALRRHTMNVLDAEMEKVRARHGCTAAAEEVEFALRRMVKQLLHVPTVRARELAARGSKTSTWQLWRPSTASPWSSPPRPLPPRPNARRPRRPQNFLTDKPPVRSRAR